MLLNIVIVAAVLVTGGVLLLPRVAHLAVWRATVTPLASIIGSGFLILGPILDKAYGYYAPLVMGALCGGAYLFGGAIRHNIRLHGRRGNAGGEETPADRVEWALEGAASWALAFAYIISVAYYLNLFGAFGVSLTPLAGPFYAKTLTTIVLVFILAVGWTKGFKMMESMEYVSVAVKLAIIGGLLIGLAVYFWGQTAASALKFTPPEEGGWSAITLAFGLIVTVQGFETSRYLGRTYDADTRVRSMRLSQWVASAIYLVYIVLIAYVFDTPEGKLTETAIIDMMKVVAPILPLLLVAAALTAQFSAAVADTSGAGGLFSELTGGRLRPRLGYALLVAVGIVLTWTLDVFEIISFASRAFAAYYALQAAIAAWTARTEGAPGWKVAGFAALAALGLACAAFGVSAEG